MESDYKHNLSKLTYDYVYFMSTSSKLQEPNQEKNNSLYPLRDKSIIPWQRGGRSECNVFDPTATSEMCDPKWMESILTFGFFIKSFHTKTNNTQTMAALSGP